LKKTFEEYSKRLSLSTCRGVVKKNIVPSEEWISPMQCFYKHISKKEDCDIYPINGFAPGNYMCHCVSCNKAFFGDKRAVQCENCATSMSKKPEANIIDAWLEKHGDPEIAKQVESEAKNLCEREIIQKAVEMNWDKINNQFKEGLNPYAHRVGFVEGAKWQSERMYSKEELLEHLNHLIMLPSSKLDEFTDDEEMVTMKWFEQFSKLKKD
jgi:hypothetical protein